MTKDQAPVTAFPRVGCPEVEDLLDSYLEDEIEPLMRKQFERHLAACENCNSMVHDCIAIVTAARELAEREIPRDVSKRLRQRLAEEIGKTGRLQIVDTPRK